MDVRAFGSWMSTARCMFFQGFEFLPEVLTRDIGANDPGTSAGYPARKLSVFFFFFRPLLLKSVLTWRLIMRTKL